MLTLNIKIQILFAPDIIRSTARASSVFLSSFSITQLVQWTYANPAAF